MGSLVGADSKGLSDACISADELTNFFTAPTNNQMNIQIRHHSYIHRGLLVYYLYGYISSIIADYSIRLFIKKEIHKKQLIIQIIDQQTISHQLAMTHPLNLDLALPPWFWVWSYPHVSGSSPT